jgi:hypothetical protein
MRTSCYRAPSTEAIPLRCGSGCNLTSELPTRPADSDTANLYEWLLRRIRLYGDDAPDYADSVARALDIGLARVHAAIRAKDFETADAEHGRLHMLQTDAAKVLPTRAGEIDAAYQDIMTAQAAEEAREQRAAAARKKAAVQPSNLPRKTWVCTHGLADDSPTESVCAPTSPVAFVQSLPALCKEAYDRKQSTGDIEPLQTCSRDVVCVVDHDGC